MKKLVDYLKQLNSTDTNFSVWVNPENLDEFRIEQKSRYDGWECIGNLETLSFGFQSQYDAINAFLDNQGDSLIHNGKEVFFDRKGILEAWGSGKLFPEFAILIETEAEKIEKAWAEEEASAKVSELEEYFSGEEYQQEKKLAIQEHEAWLAYQDQ